MGFTNLSHILNPLCLEQRRQSQPENFYCALEEVRRVRRWFWKHCKDKKVLNRQLLNPSMFQLSLFSISCDQIPTLCCQGWQEQHEKRFQQKSI